MTLKLTYAGFNYVADVSSSYTSADSLSTMISSTASNSVALTADYGINASTNTVFADSGQTVSTTDLTNEIKAAEAKGLTVTVRPLIDFVNDETTAQLTAPNGNVYKDGDWRAYYSIATAPGATAAQKTAATNAFFNSYDTMIKSMATAAQNGGAQILDIGTEIDELTGAQYSTQWTQIINDAKAIFSGKITYSAIGDDDISPWQFAQYSDPNVATPPAAGTGDFTTQISFWNKLDYVGIDTYAALSNTNTDNGSASDPTLAQLVSAWETPFTDDGNGTPTDATADTTNGKSLIQYYEGLSTTIGKPLLFTEIGYESAPDAAADPFASADEGNAASYDPSLQAKLYQAFFTAWQAQGNTSLQGVYFWNWEPNSTANGVGTTPNFTPQSDTSALSETKTAYTAAETATCYCPGTLIAVPGGERPVETLVAGDLVTTLSGAARPVKWIGRRSYAARFAAASPGVQPVRIGAGALGTGPSGERVPRRDLLVSPQHAMMLDGVLVCARDLVDGVTITAAAPGNDVHYVHVELESHDVILAEGSPSETYLEDDNRNKFHNAHEYTLAYPDEAPGIGRFCAPRVDQGEALEAIRARLPGRRLARAA